MALKQYITGLHIKNHRQFRSIHLDFCDPETHEPLEKICFIGSNGTGKSTLLELLSRTCQPHFPFQIGDQLGPDTIFCWQIQHDQERYFILKSGATEQLPNRSLTLPNDIQNAPQWNALWDDSLVNSETFKSLIDIGDEYKNIFATKMALRPNSFDLAILSVSDGVENFDKVPVTTLNKALTLFTNRPTFYHAKASTLLSCLFGR